ncbi:hypothetical protein SLE2022_110430 [Rubroshorea leprosula]
MAALSSLHNLSATLSLLPKPSLSLPCIHPIRTLHRFACSLSSSSTEFNISFAPPKPKPRPPPNLKALIPPEEDGDSPTLDGQLIIPWIVRGEDGNLKLQAHPPSRLIHSLADASIQNSKKKKDKEMKKQKKKESAAVGGAAEPKLSKAARRFYNENFRDQPQRLSKVLAAAGVASRRGSEELIFNGKVTVNGSVCNAPQTRVDPSTDIIYVNGSRLPKKLPPKVYLALNKPKGYICSSGEKEFKSVIDLFEDFFKGWDKKNPGIPKPRLFTVGRLDVATTGMLIVTNDGDFAQKLSHPSSMLKKEYIAVIDGVVKTQHLVNISKGTVIEGMHCTPDSVELMPRQPDLKRPRLRIVVHEGRNHEVRELVKNAGLEIHSLKRMRIGGFRLPSDLGLGKYVELKQSDLRAMGWKG